MTRDRPQSKEQIRRNYDSVAAEYAMNKMSMDFLFFETEEIVPMLRKSGFAIEKVVERAPYPAVEYPSHRAYVLAQRK